MRLALPPSSSEQCIIEGIVYPACPQHWCMHVQAPAAGPCVPLIWIPLVICWSLQNICSPALCH